MDFFTRQGASLGAAVGLVLAAAPAAPAGPLEGWAFTRLELGALGEAVGALAPGPGPGSVAIGDARGVGVLAGSGERRRLLHRGPVRDLAFLSDSQGTPGELLVATDDGLWRVHASGGASPLSLAPGRAARDVRRVSVANGAVALATGAGVFITGDVARWRHPSPRLPRSGARTVALRADERGFECYAVVGEHLWWLQLEPGPDGLEARRVERELLPLGRESGGPVDVVLGIAGADVIAVLARGFAVRDRPGEAWRPVVPVLPPGASARRLLSAHGRLWLATDRGLLVAHGLEGPWVRAPGPVGSAPVGAVASDASSLYVGAGDHVWRAQVRSAPPLAGTRLLRTPEGDPPIEQVQRATLAHLALGSAGVNDLRRGVARRGWLPFVVLRLARNRDEDRIHDRDEAIVSGDLRRTVDRERRSARDFETSLSFSWDLGDVLYHPEQIDVSREAREVIKLRDDVMDEVNQLYFERRRVVAELAALPDAPPAEILRLQLRAAELAAGLDSWTGGWFSRARAGAP